MYTVAALVLATSWTNLIFYSIEIVLVVACLYAESRYRLWICAMLTIDTACTAAICAQTIFVLVDPIGSEASILDLSASASWPSAMIAITTALSAFWEQAFLSHRYWKLSKSTSWIFILLAPVSLTQVTVAITSTAEIILGRNFGQLGTLITFILRAAIDAMITATLVWKLTPCNLGQSMFTRIALMCIVSGLWSSVISIVSLVFKTSILTQFIFLFSFQGRIYGLTILSNLLISQLMRKTDPLTSFNVQTRSQLDTLPQAHLPTIERYNDRVFSRQEDPVSSTSSRSFQEQTIASGLSIALPEPITSSTLSIVFPGSPMEFDSSYIGIAS